MTRRITVVTAGLGQPSFSRLLADRLAEGAPVALERRGTAAAIGVIELRDHARALVDHLLTGFASERLRTAMDDVVEADGVVAVSPIFSASYSGLFKVFFDVLEPESLAGKPVILGATGGTPRHSLALEHALRPLFSYLRAAPAPTAVYAASEDWGGADGVAGSLSERIERAAGEFADLVVAYQKPRRPDLFGEIAPFEQMLEQ